MSLSPIIRALVRPLPRPLRRLICEFTSHDTHRAPSGLFTYCLRCHCTLRRPNPPNPHLPRDRRAHRPTP